MASNIATTVASWSATAGSNQPDSTDLASTLREDLQAIQAGVRILRSAGTIASAGTTNLAAVNEEFVTITGTATITALGTVSAGMVKWLIFDGALTFTHNGTSLILPGAASITTAAGDCACMLSLGSGNWRCIEYMRASGQPITTAVSVTTVTASGAVSAGGGFPKMQVIPASNPRIDFDTNDVLGYNQTTNLLSMTIGGATQFAFGTNAATLQALAASITSNPANVFTDPSGTISRVTSLRQYKTDIVVLGPSAKFDLLRPIRYRSLCEADKDRQFYGFIAEEVADLFPLAGVYDDEGNLSNYSDRALIAHLVAEVQELKKRLAHS